MYYVIEERDVTKTDNHTRFVIQATPGKKNMSGETCLRGWLGQSGDISRYACGRYNTLEDARVYVGTQLENPMMIEDEHSDDEVWIGKPVLDEAETREFLAESMEQDITPDTTDAELEELVEEYNEAARESFPDFAGLARRLYYILEEYRDGLA